MGVVVEAEALRKQGWTISAIARHLGVALAMGLRRGEALGLAWSDVDLENGR